MERVGISSPTTAREPAARTRPPSSARPISISTTTSTSDDAKLLLVDFRSGEAVRQHPEVAPLLDVGWRIKSAVPRLVEAKGTKLLVVLTPPAPLSVEKNLA